MSFLYRISLALLATAIILLAIILGGIRLVLANIEYYKPEIEFLLSRDDAHRVTFSRVEGSMLRFNPILRIENVSVTLPDRSQPLFVDHLTLEFDFWASLHEWAPVVLEIDGQLEKLELVRDETGRWWANEFEIGGHSDRKIESRILETLAFVPRYLDLDLRRLIIKDMRTARSHQLEDVSARIDHRKDRFLLQLTASLPQELGQAVSIKSALGAERSLIYLSSPGLRIKPLANLLGLETPGLRDGELNGQVWINLDSFRVSTIGGDLALRNGQLQLAEDRNPVAIEYQSRFNAINRDSGWRIANHVLRLRLEEDEVPRFRSEFELTAGVGSRRLSAWIDGLEVSGLAALAGPFLPPAWEEKILQSQAQARLEDLVMQLNLDRPQEFQLQASLIGINSRRFEDIPGVENLDAEVVAANGRYGLKLSGQKVRLDFGDEFVAPLEFDQLSADAVAYRHPSALLLAVDKYQAYNRDISVWGRMWTRFDRGGRPFMFMRAQFANGDGRSTGKYLPVRVMPDEAVAWLNRGLKRGNVTRGDFQFHGRLRDLRELDRERAVEMYVDFEVEGADVFFQPGWLNARNGNGRVLFHNTSMLIELDQVSYDKLDQARARAYIANLDQALLELAIRAEMPAGDALQVWAGTPVGGRFRESIGKVDQVTGRVRAMIDVELPIGIDGEEKAEVTVDIENAEIRSDAWGLDMTRVNGRLEVSDDRLRARRIDALYFGDPVKIDILQEPKADLTVLRARGLVTTRNLLVDLPEHWQQGVSGKSSWQVKLKFDNEVGTADRPYLQLDAESDLKNTQIRLPQPFAKQEAETRMLSANLSFYPDLIKLDAEIGQSIKLRGRFTDAGNTDYRLDDLDIALSAALESPAGNGLRVYGHVPSVSIEDWVAFADSAGGANPSLLQSVDLSFDQVIAYNRLLDKVNLDIEQVDDKFIGRIESSLIRGGFRVPKQPSAKQPVEIDMEYLKIDKLDQDPDYFTIKPSALTDFRFHSDSLVFHDMLFNDVQIDGRVAGETLHIDRFVMRRDEVNLNSTGIWEYNAGAGTHYSSLNVKVVGTQLGEAIAGLGFGDTITEGDIELVGGFTWPAPIIGVDLENMVGDIKMRIENGVLNNVEPGSGRFVGLLSLSALPRRLSLDFSDIVVAGMEFESISGTYRIADGNLYTRNTRLKGPAAKVKISGRTGIVARDYDQEVSVTPQVRGVLNTVAVYAGNWGLLLLQNLFKKVIDDAVEIEYKISGSWDDPKIDLVKAVDENQQDLPQIKR